MLRNRCRASCLWHIVELSRKPMQSKMISAKNDPQLLSTLTDLAMRIGKATGKASQLATAVPGLTLYRNTVPTAPNPCTYEPSLLVIPQGKKRVELGKESYVFGETTFLLTSIELPHISRVCSDSVERPYDAFFLSVA